MIVLEPRAAPSRLLLIASPVIAVVLMLLAAAIHLPSLENAASKTRPSSFSKARIKLKSSPIFLALSRSIL